MRARHNNGAPTQARVRIHDVCVYVYVRIHDVCVYVYVRVLNLISAHVYCHVLATEKSFLEVLFAERWKEVLLCS